MGKKSDKANHKEKKPKDDPKGKAASEASANESGPGDGLSSGEASQQELAALLDEGQAYRNHKKSKGKSKGDKMVAIWIKKTTLNYEKELAFLQTELLKLQQHVRDHGLRVLILFEGRDSAGKGGVIKRFTQYLSPRGLRVVALSKPSDIETTQWYFQRYSAHLPSAGEIVFLDRSWYNRAMVEPVMGFCTDEQNKGFLMNAPLFESLLVKDGIHLFKFYLSISRKEQEDRFNSRLKDPLKQYKYSPVDAKALELWDQYTIRKFEMLNDTHRNEAPWTIIRTDDKKAARLECIRKVLSDLDYEGKADPERFACDPEILIDGRDEVRHMEKHLLNPKNLMG